MESLLVKISVMLAPALLAVTLHEVAHGYVADKYGDPTARLLGRLSFNPLRHLDPIGTLALLFFGFGWARPVPVNYANMQHPRQGMVGVALIGPVSNLLLAGACALLLHGLALVPDGIDGAGRLAVLEPLRLMLGFGLYVNVILGIFNLLPIPPLDGGMALIGLLPQRQSALLARIEPFGFILLVFVVFFTDVWPRFLGPVIYHVVGFLAGDQAVVVERAMRFLLAS